MSKIIRIGSRASKLALWQSEWVQTQLKERGVASEIQKIITKGDKILDVPLAKIGGKGLFVKEIEEALLREEIDLAVHSMKDMPAEMPAGLQIGPIPLREDPRDALISHKGKTLADLPQGAVVGTSSLRRQAQLLALRPDLQIVSLRGNLDTRLRKVKAGEFEAILLAAAGLHRLGWASEITEYLEPATFLPAIAQGALAIQFRQLDIETLDRILFLNHSETGVAVKAERALLARLEGGCQVPIAGHATVQENEVTLKGRVLSLDGKTLIEEVQTASRLEAESLGVAVAEALLAKGADAILKALYQ
ncbi:Porphobilinogen deaminase [hydrothermal vent metagenome]|uniref:Porphobilinogen deaminase n=1 Tax=hydrothermal vent metagenome TaxID=652676 RepID=A0A3B1CNQ7_9ZZZZ